MRYVAGQNEHGAGRKDDHLLGAELIVQADVVTSRHCSHIALNADSIIALLKAAGIFSSEY